MENPIIYPIMSNFAQSADVNENQYQTIYKESIEDPEGFWSKQAEKYVTWFAPWKEVSAGDFNSLELSWFLEGKLNACYNCVDRHLVKRSNQTAIIWQGDEPNDIRRITYAQLHQEVCRFANVLKKLNIKKGDRVCIYMPMIPEVAFAMLACARIGAIHSVVFGGFSAEALKIRILDSDSKLVITADEGVRGGKSVPTKKNVDMAVESCPHVENVLVVKRSGQKINWLPSRDVWLHEIMLKVDSDCPAEPMDANDPLFILYTSGSTGKPKGVLHFTGGYLVYVAMTYHTVFNYQEGDVYWCTADVGWITGHSYLIYGPLANGAITLMYEGVPHYPNFSRFWEIIDQHQVNIFYTAPTAIRALRREGDHWVTRTQRSSLKLLGTVGEPINPDVWEWYFHVVGNANCPIVDTWWQTETGGILITSLPGAMAMKPGAAAKPFFGILPEIVDDEGGPVLNYSPGKLVIRKPWPGLMQTIYGDRERFINTYFKTVPGCYYTGDEACRDEDGYFWIRGRNDDVIKVSGHRLETGELENAILGHAHVSEAAVVGIPHDIKGESIYAFVTLKKGVQATDQLRDEVIGQIRKMIGPIASPDHIHWTPDLPKTRSGKIMRRILRKIAINKLDELGDVSTLANPDVIKHIVKGI